jgi:hypothetical protein
MSEGTVAAASAERTGEASSGHSGGGSALPEFAGITSSDCCIDCEAERCVITGAGQCGHPRKGGLQALYQQDPVILKRYNRARKFLAMEDERRKNWGET